MNSTSTQVIIIGAGPTGLSMAAQLLRYNIDFIILEKNKATTFLSKAVAIQARTLEIFEEIGLAQKAIATGNINSATNLFYKGKKRARLDLSNLGEGLSQFPFALALEQSKTEKLLVDHLTANGKQIEWGSTFSHFTQDENKVTAFYTDADGQDQKMEADYLVGCDGASSLVRHQLNLNFEGDTLPKLFYVADVTLKSSVINKNELFIFLIKKGFVLFFAMEGEGHNRIIGILPDADTEKHFEFADIENTIKEFVEVPLEFEKLHWFSTYKVHSRRAKAFAGGRCFIAGDAGHIHTPAGGQGMNTGIQDAYNLAWKLAYRLKGKINEQVVDTYNTERVGNATHLLKTTDRMFDVMIGSNWFTNFLRLRIFPLFAGIITRNVFIKRRFFPLISQTGIAYPDSYLTQKSSIGKIKAGDRMHYFVLSNGKNIFEYLKAPTFKILCFGKEVVLPPISIEAEIHSFDEMPAIFGKVKSVYILLRPDNHISYIGESIEHCFTMLSKILKE
jgi:2-polyprenyl-6-methoxyphenol hydroxylase-like FAD-dependent oxidoreductase